jgi:two-component system response regulator FlrC
VVFDQNSHARRPLVASIPSDSGADLIEQAPPPANPVPATPVPATPAPATPAPATPTQSSLSDVAFQSEAQAILRALDAHGGHRGKTAASLGISERTLRYRLASMRENGLIEAGASS